MSWLQDFGGGIANGIAGGLINSAFSKDYLDYQAAIQEKFYRNRYQWTREDMEKAGLNPILAATNGGFGASSVGGVSGGISASDFSTPQQQASIARKAQKAAQAMQESQVILNGKLAGKADADTKYVDYQAQLARIDQEIKEGTKKFVIDMAGQNYINSVKTGQLIDKQIETQGAIALANIAAANQSNSYARLVGYEGDLKALESGFYTKLGETLGNVSGIDIPKSVVSGVGSAVGGLFDQGVKFLRKRYLGF